MIYGGNLMHFCINGDSASVVKVLYSSSGRGVSGTPRATLTSWPKYQRLWSCCPRELRVGVCRFCHLHNSCGTSRSSEPVGGLQPGRFQGLCEAMPRIGTVPHCKQSVLLLEYDKTQHASVRTHHHTRACVEEHTHASLA